MPGITFMDLGNAWNAYIFREGKSSVSGPDLFHEFTRKLTTFCDTPPSKTRRALVDLLLRSGELEAALLDVQSPADPISTATDQIAAALLSGAPLASDGLTRLLRALRVPDTLSISVPEGFAFYALHPLDFADLVTTLPKSSRVAAVIGIRSIGTTLSAIVRAALLQAGVRAERATVRPAGHPYDRRTEFSQEQRRWVATMQSRRADFFVVDEGPGISGSSFLSVGDALLAAGVPRSSITFLGSRNPDPASLAAFNAAQRWPAFRSFATSGTQHLPVQANTSIAGGIWRAQVHGDPAEWPSSWLSMERLKFLSPCREHFLKFEGHGRFGEAVHERIRLVAEHGFGPMPLGFEQGFGAYPFLRGRVLSSASATPAVLQRLAEYCAFRSRKLRTNAPANQQLETMLHHNIRQEFGVELPPAAVDLRIANPMIVDGRMAPHKWIDTGALLLKVDTGIHGDDHFFPGPTDIAWDLAGTIVEWSMDAGRASTFLQSYWHVSGDNARERIANYLLAYSIFRCAYCKMAAAAMKGTNEEPRLARDYLRYRGQAEQYLQNHIGNSGPLEHRNPQLSVA